MQEGANFMLLANVRFKLCSIKLCNKGKVLHLQLPHIIWSTGHGYILVFLSCIWPVFMQVCALTSNLSKNLFFFFKFQSGQQSKEPFVMRRNIAAHSVRLLQLLQHPAHSATVLAWGYVQDRLCVFVCICASGVSQARGFAGDEGPVGSNVYVLVTPQG